MFSDRAAHARTDAHETALEALEAGIESTLPGAVVERTVSVEGDTLRIDGQEYDLSAYDRLVVLGGGKAAGGVTKALEDVLEVDDGVVVTTDGATCERIDVLEGDHPTPSERNVEGTNAVLEYARDADENTLLLAVVTGGASALWAAPADGLTLSDLQATTEALLESGASIDEVNAVRKHCSAIKGGRLARVAAPATVATLAISDVVGDDPSVIGSGPTVADPSTFADALAVLEDYDLRSRVPDAVTERLEEGAAGDLSETPTDEDAAFDRVDWHLLANGRTAIDAARKVARDRGYETMVLSSRVRGEAREAGRFHAAVAEEALVMGDPIEPPAVVLSGGEVTVTVRGDGVGGPNQELALAAALEFAQGETDAVLASVDTDGIDGPTDACGAIVDGELENPGEARRALAENDAYSALEKAGAILETGYTGTNVNDLRVVVLEG
ncbi:glycerate kinase type-2 family protein [Natrialbaceae archaeon A-gly3]